MGIVVMKFGGTSLRNLSKQSKIIDHVKKSIEDGNKLVVVVSAIGRNGEPYATDTLINQLTRICTDINPKKKDLIMSCGEIISAAMVSHLFESSGLPSEPLMGFQAGIITDSKFTSSEILEIDIMRILNYLNEGKIVVVAGFQGITKEMEITTLGRGGSDTTAVALGCYLDADRVDIYTDVPGVAIINPSLVPSTKYIKDISYDDMYTLSSNGATVIHPKAVLIGKKYGIPIRVLSTFIDNSGTLISNINYDNKIIGFPIKDQDDKKNISIVFNKNYRDEVIYDLEDFIINNKENIIEVIQFEDKISFVVKSEVVTNLAQRLYYYFVNYV